VKNKRQFENISADPAERAPIAVRESGTARRDDRGSRLTARLPFIRAMLWVLVYATAGLFLMSVILLGGLRPQSKIIGGALAILLTLIAATYGLQWYS
jgi:hypothetical protein